MQELKDVWISFTNLVKRSFSWMKTSLGKDLPSLEKLKIKPYGSSGMEI